MDVGRLVARAAVRYRDRVALEGPDGQRTFGEVGARVAQLARGLLGLGLEPGDRVLDLQSNAMTYVETDYGLCTAGLCRVALNTRLSPADWGRIAADSGARALIYHAKYAGLVAGLLGQVEHAVVIGGEGPGLPYEQLLADQPDAPLLLDPSPDDLVSLNYSSGTTGNPKGAKRTHRNRFASLTNILADILGARPDAGEAWCHAGPLTHASGLFSLPHFVLGGRQVILEGWDPEALLEAIEHRGVTGTVLVPTMVARLLAHPGLSTERTANLRRLVYAGSPMPPEQVRQALARITPNMVQMYGLVEAIPPVTVLSAADHATGDAEVLGSAGKPCLGVALRIVDEAGDDVPEGEVGEVISAGDHVMSGYWGAADATAVKTVVGGWLHTGDLGREVDGRLYLVDRKGDMIITGGYNVFPREVEDVIAEVPGVAEVAVLGIDDPDWGQRITALYRVAEGASVSEEAIMAHCRDRLAAYKKPKDLRRVESFPLSATGKIAKKVLRAELAPS